MKIVLSVLLYIIKEFIKTWTQLFLFFLIIILSIPAIILGICVELLPISTARKSNIETILFKPVNIIFKLFDNVQ